MVGGTGTNTNENKQMVTVLALQPPELAFYTLDQRVYSAAKVLPGALVSPPFCLRTMSWGRAVIEGV